MREWLLQMSMLRVLEMDESGLLFNLPAGGMEALSNVMGIAPGVPRLALSHLELVEAFKSAGPPGEYCACNEQVVRSSLLLGHAIRYTVCKPTLCATLEI